MDKQTIIKQLEKALSCKEDKEMRLRVEVLVDILKNTQPAQLGPAPAQAAQPTALQGANAAPIDTTPRYTMSRNGEQLNYSRPAGT